MNYQQTVGLTALGILFFAATAHAEDCQITLSQPVVDYHEMRRDNIDKPQQNWHKMADRTLNVNVYCPQPQQMAVLLQGTAGDKGRFTFGQSGGMAVKIDEMTVDGKNYTVGKTVDQLNFTPQSGTPSPFYVRNNEAVIAVDNNQVPSGQQMNFRVTLSPVLDDSAFSRITDQTALESDLTWTLLTK
ncbi:hypothetical protein [Enterobacter quasiroggenkampii]|uniref:hypothetical protein n=1 Tax=Enterobacter quasiroggenkampii TaxID=2497436 RepID=UPI0039C401B6